MENRVESNDNPSGDTYPIYSQNHGLLHKIKSLPFWPIVISGIVSIIVTYTLPYIQETISDQTRTRNYVNELASDNISEVQKALSHVETGSPAESYTKIILNLWKSGYYKLESEDSLPGPNSSPEEETTRNYGTAVAADTGAANWSFFMSYITFCYPDFQPLPDGCMEIDDFRFSNSGYIESFTMDDVPISSLIVGNGNINPESDLISTENQESEISAFAGGTIISSDYTTSTTYLVLRPRHTGDTRDILINPTYRSEDRLENDISSELIFPPWIGHFNEGYASLSLPNTGRAFTLICTSRGDRESTDYSTKFSTDQGKCAWISLTRQI